MSFLLGEGLAANLCDMFLVNFAVRRRFLEEVVPSTFQLEVRDGYGFISAVIAKVEAMRPPGVPRILGRTFDAIVYRVPVRYESATGRWARGVYFLRSDVSDCLLGFDGFWRRLFKSNVAIVTSRQQRQRVVFSVRNPMQPLSWADAEFDLSRSADLPDASHFESTHEAVDRLIELYAAFDYDPVERRVAIVPIQHAQWNVRVVHAVQSRFDFIESIDHTDPHDAHLDSVFYVARVPYRWYPPIFEPVLSGRTLHRQRSDDRR